MSIYFRNTPVSAPFMFESLGNHWNQVNIFRPDGYPYYHYLQTEKGTGRIEVRGKFYTLGASPPVSLIPITGSLLPGPRCLPPSQEHWQAAFLP